MAEKGVKSARGVIVDFDLMKIKEQIANAPKAVTVQARIDFIDQKSRRRLARQIKQVVAEVNTAPMSSEDIVPSTPEEVQVEPEAVPTKPKRKSNET
jgi:hypothetical protein